MLCFGISLSSTAGFNSFRPLPTGVRCGFRMIEIKTSTINPLNMIEDMSDIFQFYCFPSLSKNRPLVLQLRHSKERRFAPRRWEKRKCCPVKSEVWEPKSDDTHFELFSFLCPAIISAISSLLKLLTVCCRINVRHCLFDSCLKSWWSCSDLLALACSEKRWSIPYQWFVNWVCPCGLWNYNYAMWYSG